VNNLTLPQELIYFSWVKVRLIMGVCKYELCKDWANNGCGWPGVHDFTGSIPNIGQNGNAAWGCGGGCCNGTSSYSTRSEGRWGVRVGNKQGGGECDNTELIAYEKPNYRGHSQVMRGHYERINREGKPGCHDDWWASIRERKIPNSIPGKLSRRDTNAECHGADTTYKRVSGETNACFYSATDASKIRSVFHQKSGNSDMSSLFTALKTEFCRKADNVFKNPGGGMCLEYDEGKRLAKQYCQVGNRIATDASCTEDNLGNHYEELAVKYCKKHGRNDQWCSCYNVSNDVCKTHPTVAGCAKKKQVFDPLVEATPEKFRHVWSGKAKCFGSVCVGKKYVPTNANQGCDAPVQICAQSFDISNVSGSTIEAKCEQTAIQNISSSQPSTQPSAGDSPSGPTPAPGATPAPAPTPDTGADQANSNKRKKIVLSLVALIMIIMIAVALIILL